MMAMGNVARKPSCSVQAYEIEEGASRLLQQLAGAKSGESGIVHSVYRSTVNIWWPSNEWLVIGTRSSLLMPNMIRLHDAIDFVSFPLFIKSGSKVDIYDGRLYMNGYSWCALDASHSSALTIPTVEQIAYADAIALLTQSISANGCPGGAMLPWLALAGQAAPQTLHERQLHGALQQLAEDAGSGSEGRLYEGAARLVGMGIGLTPSGDDFLTGLFAALAAADPAHRQWPARERGLWLSRARGRTTFVAYEMLRHVLGGKVNQALLQLIQALDARTGASAGQIQLYIKQLLAIGSTSGTDMAAGLAFGLAYLQGKRA